MNRRDLVKQVLGTAVVVVVPMTVLGDDMHSYNSATISMRMVEEQPGITSLYLLEHGDADYVVVEAFYWTTIIIRPGENGQEKGEQRVLLHKETTAPLSKGIYCAADLAMPLASIVFLRVKEMNLLKQTEFGEMPHG
jgi:hypothetical protein